MEKLTVGKGGSGVRRCEVVFGSCCFYIMFLVFFSLVFMFSCILFGCCPVFLVFYCFSLFVFVFFSVCSFGLSVVSFRIFGFGFGSQELRCLTDLNLNKHSKDSKALVTT